MVRAGFSLAEVIVAMTLMAVALLGLVSVAAFSAASLNVTALREQAAVSASAVLDSLVFAPVLEPGGTDRDGLRLEWSGSAEAGGVVRVQVRGPRGVAREFAARRVTIPPMREP